MADKIGSSFSCVSTSLYSPFQSRRRTLMSLSRGFFGCRKFHAEQSRNAKVMRSCRFSHGKLVVKGRDPNKNFILFATSEDELSYSELNPDATEAEIDLEPLEDIPSINTSYVDIEGNGGRPGLISFYNRPSKREDEIIVSNPGSNQSNILWFAGPAVLVSSFVFPSLYMRRLLSAVFEDSLLTDFLILFFTEALFYCGVAVFLQLVDRLQRPISIEETCGTSNRNLAPPRLGQRISSVAVLVLSLVIPMVTMGFVWPWTGPAASATLAPYLVGIVVQFAFEQYAKYKKSPSWPVIPIIFQVYRLHQLNRAAQLVTALSFTVRGAEMTTHNLAINSSLGTLLNVLQFLGVICIWSLSSFVMRFFPHAAATTEL